MSVILCAYVWICIRHYAYPDLRVFDFFRVEGYAFNCLRFCKFLLSQTLNGQKGCTFLYVCCRFDGAWCGGGVFFFLYMHSSQVCIPRLLANLVSSYELFILCFVATTTSRLLGC
jgi:hypothetical protein